MFKCIKTVKLFNECKIKNRRMNSKEMETEFELCKWMKRPPRTMLHDPPFYPWVPPTPLVNFDLKYKE